MLLPISYLYTSKRDIHTHTRTGFFVCVHEILHPSYIRGRGGGIEHYSSCHSSSCCCCSCVCTIMSACWGIHTGTVWLAIIKRLSLPYILLLLLHLEEEEDERKKELQYIYLIRVFFFFLGFIFFPSWLLFNGLLYPDGSILNYGVIRVLKRTFCRRTKHRDKNKTRSCYRRRGLNYF